MSELVTCAVDDGIAFVTVDNPPVNALSPGVPEGIGEAVQRAQVDPDVRAIVIIGAGRSFIAGADIKQLQRAARGETTRSPRLLSLLRQIEDGPKPVIAAIHGQALGGGLELAMACHYRIATTNAKVGQPEVKLGIIPGAAGTQRLPRLVGVLQAARMCAIGDPISAQEGERLGLLDKVVEGDLRREALLFAKEVLHRTDPPPCTRARQDKLALADEDRASIQELRRQVQKRSRGMLAPLAAIDAVEATTQLSFDEGCEREQELFQKCLGSGQAAAMMHLFFGERAVAKIPGLPPDVPILPIEKVGVIGGGTMGTGIATTYLAAGIPVALVESQPGALEKSVRTIRSNLAGIGARRGWSEAEVSRLGSMLAWSSDLNSLADVDLVIEAVFESMALKREIFEALGKLTKADCVLASNTSTLDIDSMAEASVRPAQVVGHHFFSPAHVMRLLEIVRGKQTSPSVLATSLHLAKRLGKVGVVVGNCTGFVGNRMYGPYQREAQFLVEEGATPEQIDRVMQEFGMAMGPLAVGDLAGLDVGWRIRKEHGHLQPSGWRQPRIADRLCEMGRFGQKTGKGWYHYEAGRKEPIADPEVEEIIEAVSREASISRREITDREIEDRLLMALIIEGARILEEGYAYRAVDIDVIYANGYGFPAHKGGPMFHADAMGLSAVLGLARDFTRQLGEWWSPPALLETLLREGRSFTQQN